MKNYTESFDTSDGPLGPDLTWTSTNLVVVSRGIGFPAARTSGRAAPLAATDSVNQYVQIQLTKSASDGAGFLLMYLRWNGTSLDQLAGLGTDYYYITHFLSTGNWAINKVAGGVFAALATGNAAIGANDTIRFEVSGSRLRYSVNGTQIAQATDSAITTGNYVAIADTSGGLAGAQWGDSFAYGDDAGLPPRTSNVPFLQANDRYQIVACVNQATSTTTPEFRYWNAGPPLWDEAIAGVTYPPFHTLDENSNYTPGSVELPFVAFHPLRRLMAPEDISVNGVLVQYIPRPSTLNESIPNGYPVGFSGRVEGIGVPDYLRTSPDGATVSGITVSDTFSYSLNVQDIDTRAWPNVRTAWMPVHLDQRVRAARVIFTDIHLVRLMRIQLVGEIHALRNV